MRSTLLSIRATHKYVMPVLMESKAQKLSRVLKSASCPALEPPQNFSQEIYRRKLATDIARTKKFIQQADAAIEQLEQKYGPCPEVYDESISSVAGGSESLGKHWGSDTMRQVHLLAHHEVFKQMPYQSMKNDLIGIATGLTLTLDAVSQQALASDVFQSLNESTNEEISLLNAVLADFKLANILVKDRIQKHPQRMEEMQERLDNLSSYDTELDSKLVRAQQLSDLAKAYEERLHQHLLDVMMRLHAMMDSENSHLMDENTFKKNIGASISFLKSLVSSVVEDLKENWIPVNPGTTEERLAEVMIRNDILLSRYNYVMEVKLRGYGLS